MSPVIASPTVNGDNLRQFRPALSAIVVVLHLGVAAIAYETQGHFYARLHSPANLGYGLVDIALQPTTFAITAAILAVVAAAYMVARRLRLSLVVLPLVALVASVTITMVTLGADADAKATQVEAGRPACSGDMTPYRLCAQRVFVSRVSGADLSWLTNSGDQALYLGVWGHRYVLIDPTSHQTYSVSQQDVALAGPLT